MNENLYQQQVQLEEEARGLTIKKFHKDHERATDKDAFGDTFLGSKLIRAYLVPYTEGLTQWLLESNSGRVGRRSRAAVLLDGIDPKVISFLVIKTVINQLGVYSEKAPVSFTSLAFSVAAAIHEELRLQEFDKEFSKLSKTLHNDFNKRELPHDKRLEYMQRAFKEVGLEWAVWDKSEMLFVGTALLDIFRASTGDLLVETVGLGKHKRDIVLPSEELRKLVEDGAERAEALFSVFLPTVIPPRDWTPTNLDMGGYYTENITQYPLVKRSSPAYRKTIKSLADGGTLDRVLLAVNAVQNTPWKVNVPVLDAMLWVYKRNLPCGKLPQSDDRKPEPAPERLLALPFDHPEVVEYRSYRFRIHEENRRSIGKRVMAGRSFSMGQKFSQHERFYFPHDLDSRGRMYPKPAALSPQGPDYVKGLLMFADGLPLGERGVYWLGVHGANCFGFDKEDIDVRYQWAMDHIEIAKDIAADPKGNLEWTKADNPAQYLAWCFEWAGVWSGETLPEDYVSHLHVDLDATCSGLQHFSAMLRDEVGGFHVNMVPGHKRQDVYGAVATVVTQLLKKDKNPFAKSWLDFGIDRSLTKRPVMVKPYSGTRTSCGTYVSLSVDDKIKEGSALPVPKEELWKFKQYGADKVWAAIPKVVVAADGAMKWLMTMSRLVGKSQPDAKRIEWTTPLGFPVWQSKFDVKSLQIKTFFNGGVIRPRYNEVQDTLDSRKMASSVPPSFVHSLDGCHLQATISRAALEGMTHFAVVHDSFGTHAANIDRFARIIREEFVAMYEDHDVLQEFADSVLPLIDERFLGEVPPIPEKGKLDLQGIKANEFFFS